MEEIAELLALMKERPLEEVKKRLLDYLMKTPEFQQKIAEATPKNLQFYLAPRQRREWAEQIIRGMGREKILSAALYVGRLFKNRS